MRRAEVILSLDFGGRYSPDMSRVLLPGAMLLMRHGEFKVTLVTIIRYINRCIADGPGQAFEGLAVGFKYLNQKTDGHFAVPPCDKSVKAPGLPPGEIGFCAIKNHSPRRCNRQKFQQPPGLPVDSGPDWLRTGLLMEPEKGKEG